MNGFPVILIIFSAFLVGCTTAEYRSARNECRSSSYSKYPEKLKSTNVNRTRYETVPDGKIRCRKLPWPPHDTTCSQGTRQIAIPYTETVTIDLNKELREQEIRSCTRKQCQRRYGNSKCETGRPSSLKSKTILERIFSSSSNTCNSCDGTYLSGGEMAREFKGTRTIICNNVLSNGTKVQDHYYKDKTDWAGNLIRKVSGRQKEGEWKLMGPGFRIKLGTTKRPYGRWYNLKKTDDNRYVAYDGAGQKYMSMDCR